MEDAGIQCLVRNEALSGVEVPIPAFYPALCVMNESDVKSALAILKNYQEEELAKIEGEDIECSGCHEQNPANFETCWSCEAAL